MGLYDDHKWRFDSGFKLEATIDGARPYADILPVANAIYQTPPRKAGLDEIAIISLLERNYFATWKDLVQHYELFGLSTPSERTLRRLLRHYRFRIIKPYIHIENIGLTKTVIVSLSAESTADVYKLLRAQSVLFPKVHVISSRDSIVLVIELPQNSDWLLISNTMSNIVGSPTLMCTFIADQIPKTKWLENIALYVVKRTESR